MSVYDQTTLRAIGVGLTHREVPIPLYVRKQVLSRAAVDSDLIQIQSRPLSQQILAALIFQIVDVSKFQR